MQEDAKLYLQSETRAVNNTSIYHGVVCTDYFIISGN